MSDVTAAKKPRGTDDVPVPPTLRKSLKSWIVCFYDLRSVSGTGIVGSTRVAAVTSLMVFPSFMVFNGLRS